MAFFEAGTSMQAHRLATLASDESFQDASDVVRQIECLSVDAHGRGRKRSPAAAAVGEPDAKRVCFAASSQCTFLRCIVPFAALRKRA